MKDGLSGNIAKEMEVSARWEEAQQDARQLLAALKSRKQPKMKRTGKGTAESDEFRNLAGKIVCKKNNYGSNR